MFTNLFALRILINYMLQAHLDFVNYTSCMVFANTKSDGINFSNVGTVHIFMNKILYTKIQASITYKINCTGNDD